MFNILIILIAVINSASLQESPDVDTVAILSGLSTATLDCSMNFNREFVAENEAIAAAIEESFAQREEADVSREPNKPKDEAEATEAPSDVVSRRNLRSRGNGRDRRRGDVTSELLDDDSTWEPKDATGEPRGRKNRGDDSTREPCDDDKADVTREAEATGAPSDDLALRRKLRNGGKGRGRGDDTDVTSEPLEDSTREPKDATREPRGRKNRDDDSREPCDDDKTDVTKEAEVTEAPSDDLALRRKLRNGGKGRGRGDDDDVTSEPLENSSREPKEATREPRGRKNRGDDSPHEPCDDDKVDVTREAEPTGAPVDLALRRKLRNGGKGRGRGDDNDVTSEPLEDSTREPKDATREPRGRKNRDSDSTREPCDDDQAEATEAPSDATLRRNLRKGRGHHHNDVTSEPLDDSTREPKDATREPRGRKKRDNDSTREPCEEDKTDVTGEAEATESPTDLALRRNLRNQGNGRGRGNDDSTREPRDVTREPCDDDTGATDAPSLRRLLRRGRGCGDSTREPKDVTHEQRGRGRDSDDDSTTTAAPLRRLLQEVTEQPDDSTKEPCDRTREPCVGDDCRERKGRKGGRKARKDEYTTEAPEEVPALRRDLGKNGGRRKGLEATISNGIVDIAGVTGEVVFGDVDETLESLPLTLTLGETTFQCDVKVRRGGKVSCVAVSGTNFQVRVGCSVVEDELEI